MPSDPPGYRPYTWAEEQEYIELPRRRSETDTDYSVRRSVASLSAAILSSLQSVIHRWDY